MNGKGLYRTRLSIIVWNMETILAGIAMCAMVSVLCGCSTNNIPQVVTQTHTTLRADSLTHLIRRLIHETNMSKEKETVFVFQNHEIILNENGDTVKETTEHITDRNLELESRVERLERENDSLRNVSLRVDSVDRPVPYPVEVPVERGMCWWEKTLAATGGVVLAVMILYVALRYKRAG